ncbi:MAG TPA: nicotinamide riboside transporter PnuC [Planctomycetota bacterium]|nr:nicotinamide riboside transporter PnuC [Planctomycetota bacterium]
MNRTLEIAANVLNAASILLAGFNRIHTWWVGIAGCALFGWLFYRTQLYADATLQLFFIVTSILGWRAWVRGESGQSLPVRRTLAVPLLLMFLVGVVGTAGYGWLLWRFTNAFAPFMDSVVLAFSILAQLLLMQRRYESWYFWLLVNTIAVPLFATRGLTLTAVLYAGFWINALVALVRWRRLIQA